MIFLRILSFLLFFLVLIINCLVLLSKKKKNDGARRTCLLPETPFHLLHSFAELPISYFSGFSKDDWKVNSEWHYVKAYAAFKQMYPRITTGNPLDPWRKLEGDRSCSQKSCKTVARLFQPHQQQGKKDEDRAQQLKPVFYGANVNQVHVGLKLNMFCCVIVIPCLFLHLLS